MSLLSLHIDKYRVSLPDDFVIRLVYSMPYPFLDTIPAAITFWFSLPSNDENDIIFQHANYIYVSKSILVFDCVLAIGNRHMKGKLYLKNADIKNYKAFIVFNDLVQELSSKKLNQVVSDVYSLGTTVDAIITQAKTLQQTPSYTSKYGFPTILNSLFFDGNNPTYEGFMNQWLQTEAEYAKNYYDAQSDIAQNRNVLVPQPYLLFVLDAIFEKAGFKIAGSIKSNPDYHKLLLYSNHAQEKIRKDDYLFGINELFQSTGGNTKVELAKVLEDDNTTWAGNTYSSSLSGVFRIRFRATCWCNNIEDISGAHLNRIYITAGTNQGTFAIGDGLCNFGHWFFYEFDVNLNLNTPTIEFYADAGNYHTQLTNLEIEIFPFTYFNADIFEGNVELKNHLPDITVSDFVNNLVKKFCLAPFFDFETHTFELTNWTEIIGSNDYVDISAYVIADSEYLSFDGKKFSLITSWDNDELLEGNFTVTDKDTLVTVHNLLSTYPSPSFIGQLMLLFPANMVYSAVQDENGDLKWAFKSDFFWDITSTEIEAEPVESSINTLFVRAKSGEYFAAIQQAGTCNQAGNNDPGFKLFNNHGFVDDNGADAAWASSTNKDFNGEVLGGFNLNMGGIDGLYNTLHKKFYDYLSSRKPIEMQLDLEEGIFHKLTDLYRVSQKKRKVRAGAKNFLPEKLDVSIGLNEFKSCKITLR